MKRKNPPDLNLIEQIQITKRKDGPYLTYEVWLGLTRLGFAKYIPNTNFIEYVTIFPPYDRKGIGTYLYNYIENDLNIIIKPSPNLESAGVEFWKKRHIRKNPVNFNYGNLRRWIYLNLPKYQPLTDTKIEELTRNALLFFNIPRKTGTKPIRFIIKYFALKYIFEHTNKHWWRDFTLINYPSLREVLQEADEATWLWWDTMDYESYYGGFI